VRLRGLPLDKALREGGYTAALNLKAPRRFAGMAQQTSATWEVYIDPAAG
jgi:hypothetical protein